MKKLSDFEIIESVNRGNNGDFELLIDRYKDKAFSMLKRILKNEFDAEEVLQDCFIKAYYSLENFRGDSKFSTWFYKIVYNSALSAVTNNKRKIREEMSSVDEHFDLSEDDNKIYAESNNSREYLLKLVDKLPPRHSLVIILFYIDGMSLEEISKVIDQSIMNVKVMLHRSRNELRYLLEKHNYREELL